jgi:hypothetical protein
MCRVELGHRDADSQESAVEAVPRAPPFDGDGLMRLLADPPRTLVYIARAGTTLAR